MFPCYHTVVHGGCKESEKVLEFWEGFEDFEMIPLQVKWLYQNEVCAGNTDLFPQAGFLRQKSPGEIWRKLFLSLQRFQIKKHKITFTTVIKTVSFGESWKLREVAAYHFIIPVEQRANLKDNIMQVQTLGPDQSVYALQKTLVFHNPYRWTNQGAGPDSLFCYTTLNYKVLMTRL